MDKLSKEEFLELGNKCAEAHEFENAVKMYMQALRIDSGYYQAVDNLGFVFMDMARWDDAIENFKDSIQLNPDNYVSHFSMGECLMRKKEYAKAIEKFEMAIRLKPSYGPAKKFLNMCKSMV